VASPIKGIGYNMNSVDVVHNDITLQRDVIGDDEHIKHITNGFSD